MTNKRLLNELTRDELSALYDTNNYIQNAVYEMRNDDEYYYIQNEIYSYFRTYNEYLKRETFTANFDVDSYNRVSVKVDDVKIYEFINDCFEFCLHGIGLDDETNKIIKRLHDKNSLFLDVFTGYYDMSDKQYDLFYTWFNNGINKIKNALSSEIESIYNSVYDDEYNKEFFIEGVLELGYFEDIQTDGKNVYFEVCKG